MTKNEYFRKLGELCDREEISEDTFNEMMCMSDAFCEEEDDEEEAVLEIGKIDIKVETFCTAWDGNLYCVDICEDAEERSAWLYNSRYGIKTHVLGQKVERNRDEFLDTVFSNLPDYIEDYAEEYGY